MFFIDNRMTLEEIAQRLEEMAERSFHAGYAMGCGDMEVDEAA